MEKDKVQTVEINEKVMASNDELARQNRERFKKAGIKKSFNLIGSPGAGKTALLEQVVPRLDNCAIIEGDIATARDAQRIHRLGGRVVQITTRGACHLDAGMVSQVFPDFSLQDTDYLFIENVGNLVCPTGYDLGEDHKIVVISLPEGEDKAAKYPAIFRKATLCVINKTDLGPYCGVEADKLQEDILSVNPEIAVQRVSCETGEGIDDLIAKLKKI